MRRFALVLSRGKVRRLPLALLLLGTLAGMAPLTAQAELTEPRAADRQVALVVTSLLRREHLSKSPLDDSISQRGLKTFLKALVAMMVSCMRGYVEEFSRRENDLDDLVKAGDLQIAYDVFNRFLQRIDERVAVIDQLLAAEHDFTVNEEMISDPDLATYAANADEAKERWRKRIKYDLLVLKADKTTGKEALDKLHRRYHSFAKRMRQTDGDELLEMFLTSVTSSFDPHTTYMSPTSLDNFYIQMRLELQGIGAALKVDDGYTVVTNVIPGGAADKEGTLKEEDRIVSVGQGDDGEMVDVVDMKLTDVVKLIRGEANTVVRLGVIPAGGTETKIIRITRAKIELKDSEARGQVIEDGRKADGTPYRVGVIDLPSFYSDMEAARRGVVDFKSTTKDVRKLLDGFREQRVDAVILDLRNNGGGSLTEAINLTGLFIDTGAVVQVKDSAGKVQHYDNLDKGMAWEGPLVVLTSKFSASASEILAGAIQDYRRGLIVGDPATHGKGTVQSLLDLGSQLFRIPNPPNLGALKITMQQFYRPNGDSTQKRGVLADVILPSITAHMDVAESDLDFALEFDRVPAATLTDMKLTNPELVAKLRAGSEQRIAKSEEFAKLLRNIERYKEQKARTSVNLNEKDFFDRRKDIDAEREEEKQFEEQEKKGDEVVRRDFYFNEALAITLDYIDQIGKNHVAASGR